MNSEYMIYTEEPLLFVSYDITQNKFIVNEEAIHFIQSITDPISIVAMAGNKGIGKSFLLNKFVLSTTKGFQIHQESKASYNIWIWSKPLKGKGIDGSDASVLVLDFDGFIENDKISSKLLTIAILISSHLLYNTNNGIFNEEAIESMGDIVQLPKNIQIRAKLEQAEFDDYANYFPSLLWISRDDNMLKIDENGDPINFKEYMESMLEPQNGFTDIIEKRNRIKTHIVHLFKDRDLLTITKPVEDDSLLPNLPNFELNDIRAEFLESIMELRKKVLTRTRLKIIDNVVLNGDILAMLIKSYIDAINKDIKPNIETIWSLTCKNACQKAISQSIKLYDETLADEVLEKLPVPEHALKAMHKSLKEKCVEIYKTLSIAQIAKNYEQELRKQLKMRYNRLFLKNQEDGQRICSNFLKREFATVDKKLKNNEYESYQEFESDIDLFFEYFMEKGPNCPNKQVIILDHLMCSLKMSAASFIKILEKKLDQERVMNCEMKTKFEEGINQLKQNYLESKYMLQSKVSELESHKAELEAKEQTLMENLERLKTEKNQVESNLCENWEKDRIEQKRTIQELNKTIIDYEEKLKDLQEKCLVSRGEFDQSKVLLEQKVEFLEKSNQEAVKRESETMQTMSTLKNELTAQLKETTSRYEKMVKELQAKIEFQQEKIHTYEETLEAKEADIDNLTKKNIQTITEKDERIDDLKNKLKNYEKLIQDLKDDGKYELQNSKLLYESRIEELIKKNEEANANLKQKEEYLKGVKARLEKENAILNQKIHFMEADLENLRNQLVEAKKNHEQIMKSFEIVSNEASQRYDAKQFNDLKNLHNKDIKELTEKYEAIKNKLQNQVEELSSKNNELELMIKIKESDFNGKEAKFKEEFDRVDSMRQKLVEQNKNLEAQKMKSFKECEARFINKIKNLEAQLEEKDMIYDQNMREMNERSEISIGQLKSVFEMEKQRLEKKLQEDKIRYEKQITSQTEEFEEKLKDEQAYFDEEMENLTQELKEKEIQYQLELQNYEREISLRQQSIETLEQYLKEAKDNLNALQQKHAVGMEQNLENFTQERKNFTSKIEAISLELAKFEKENFSLKQRIEQIEVSMNKREEAYEQLQKEFAEEKATLVSRIEDTKQKLQKVSDEYMEKKMEFGKELALNIQQTEFLKKKVEQLKKQNDDLIAEYEEKLKVQKQEQQADFNEFKEKISTDYKVLEEKYETKKKFIKDMQANYQKEISSLEKEKAILQEKINLLNNKKDEKDEEEINQIQGLNNQIAKLKETLNNEKKTYAQELDKLKKTIQNLQHESIEITSNYERDKALWDGKFQFLEQQRDQAKSDFLDLQKKFELTVQSLQKIRSLEKDDIENSQNALIAAIETKYNKKVEELTLAHQDTLNELNEKKNKLEKELKALNDKMMMDNYGKIGNQTLVEQKLDEMMDNEKQLLAEIDELKKDRDTKVIEYQNKLDLETESLRQKIREYDNKYKESENKRNSLMFEFEKERTKWNMEKDYFNNQRSELQDTINKLEKKKEALLRENEKLKSDNKNVRKSNVGVASALSSMNNNLGAKNLLSNPTKTVSPISSKTGIGFSTEKENQGFSAFLMNPKSLEGYRSSFDLYKNNTQSQASNLSTNNTAEPDTEEANA